MTNLPILMYHNITDTINHANKLTISKNFLEKQFIYLTNKGYNTLHFKDLENSENIKGKNIILTFDDITKNQLDFAIPLLKKYNLKATFFIPFAFIGKTDEWNNGEEQLMNLNDLKNIDNFIELGYHSYSHRKFSELSPDEIDKDFYECFRICKRFNLNVFPVLAYPYGNFPKTEPNKKIFFKSLEKNGIKYGLRIGNKLNPFPIKNTYEIKRIDVKGTDSFFKFKFKLLFGKIF